MKNHEKLIAHAKLTVDTLTKATARRRGNGLKNWEKKLLASAKDSLGQSEICSPQEDERQLKLFEDA